MGRCVLQGRGRHAYDPVPKMRPSLKKAGGRFAFVKEFLSRELPEAVMYIPEATYLAWVDVSALNLSAEEQLALLKRAGVRLSMGGEYGAGGETFWRVNLACPKSTLRAALERIAAEVEKL